MPLQDGDFDGDGKDDFTVVREENGNFSHYILPSGGGGFRRIVFGPTSDYLVTTGADFTGDGRDEVIIYRVWARCNSERKTTDQFLRLSRRKSVQEG